MPPPLVKSFAKKSGKSEAEVEKLWKEAKASVKKAHPEVDEKSDRFYEIVVGYLKKMCGIKESVVMQKRLGESFKEITTS